MLSIEEQIVQLTRGVEETLLLDELRKKLETKKPLRIKAGFDPTAPEGEFATVEFGVAHQNQGQLQVNQLLLDGSYFVALQASKVFKETKRLESEQAEIEARKNAAQSYYGVLVAEKTVSILEQNLVL